MEKIASSSVSFDETQTLDIFKQLMSKAVYRLGNKIDNSEADNELNRLKEKFEYYKKNSRKQTAISYY
ncbi:hypothetical protein ACXIT0_07080 [Methylorubrum extorquens]